MVTTLQVSKVEACSQCRHERAALEAWATVHQRCDGWFGDIQCKHVCQGLQAPTIA